MPDIVRYTRLSLVVLAAAFTALSACASGADAPDESFPKQVPRLSHKVWLDAPLEASLEGELTKIRSRLVSFLDHTRTIACQDEPQASIRQATEQVERHIGRATRRGASEAERQAMATDVNLIPLESADAEDLDEAPGKTPIGWQCAAPVHPSCFDVGAHAASHQIYSLYLDKSSISGVAAKDFLSVLRRDMNQTLPQIIDAADLEAATARIEGLCEEGSSPLGNYFKESADADDEQVRKLARRFGGNKPCRRVAGLYKMIFDVLDRDARSLRTEAECGQKYKLRWQL